MTPAAPMPFVLPASTTGQEPCACAQPSRDQLALIGASFVAGVAFGQGLPAGQVPSSPPLNATPKAIVHGIPTLPLRLNGKRAAPESVKDFDGKPLHYVIDDAALAGEAVSVFTEEAGAHAFVAKGSAAPRAARGRAVNINTGSTPQQIADAIGGAVLLFEHINYAGAQWRFGTGTTGWPEHGAGDGNVRDFRSVYCFLWWCQNIENRVSSIQNLSEVWADVRPARSFVVLHDLPGFGGATLMVPERATIANLVPYGWNDRASSMSYRVI